MDVPELIIRPVTDEELPAFNDTEMAAFDGDRIVGTAGIYSFQLTVPGPPGRTRQLEAAGVTAVGVLPTHRRRGILTRLMARQLDDIAERGEPLALLTASEGGIYGRFGYGAATFFRKVDVDSRRARLIRPPEGPGRVLLLDNAEAAKVLPAVYDRTRRVKVGEVSRSEAWWTELLRDSEHHQGGHGKRFDAVHERVPGEADGYVTYRFQHNWVEQQPRGIVHVEELVAADDEVHSALWSYLLGIDLAETVRGYVPLDDPMAWRLIDGRSFRTSRIGEHVWLRVLDVPAALAGRGYGADGRLVLRVDDRFRPASGGTFRLVVADGTGEAGPARGRPDLELAAGELGSLYLGGVAWRDLARAGRVAEHTPGALELADRMFASYPAPWSSTDF